MRLTLSLFLLVALAACQSEPAPPPAEPDVYAEPSARVATASLSPTEGNAAAGTVTFTQTESGVQVSGTLTGLAPGEHGFHVHENGDCGPGEDGTPGGAAGGHFAPQGSPHGAPANDAASRHVGDLGNVTVGADSSATVSLTDALLSLEGANSIVGRAVVVHADADDLTSQPSGNAGGRVACGVVTLTDGPVADAPTGETPAMPEM